MIRVSPIEIADFEANIKRARMWLQLDAHRTARAGGLPAQWEADETVRYVREIAGIPESRLFAYSAMAFGEAW